MPDDLVDYIKKCLARGFSKNTIETELLKSGWNKEQIDQAFRQSVTSTGTIQSSSRPLIAQQKSEKKIWSGKLILILGSVLIVFFLIAGGSYYFLNLQQSKKTQTATTQPTPISKLAKETEPSNVVSSFLNAARAKDKVSAKTFISKNAYGEAFKSILDSQYQGPSIYNKDFTFKIIDSKINEDSVTAQVKIEEIVGGQSLQVQYLIGKEDGSWKLLDSWVVTPPEQIPSNFADLLKAGAGEFKRSVIYLSGPAHFSLSSPLYGSIGFGINNTTTEEVAAFYSGPDMDPEHLSIMDLSGVWIMKVTGVGSGEFTIVTEIVDKENHQVGTFKHTINKGEIKYFSVSYPSQKGTPISVVSLK